MPSLSCTSFDLHGSHTHPGSCYVRQQRWQSQRLKPATSYSESSPLTWLRGSRDITKSMKHQRQDECHMLALYAHTVRAFLWGFTSCLSVAEMPWRWRRAAGRHVARLAAGWWFRNELVQRNWLQDSCSRTRGHGSNMASSKTIGLVREHVCFLILNFIFVCEVCFSWTRQTCDTAKTEF